ncbi:hypothetical protein [Silanimonas sp.]|uniref:hypothetical protein n=1 Tax=Silanimonas sp. TaxID=1929290 RepID=UPI0022BB70E5|nr:hypothetical protein [Silanimonas sp.]MCZ8061791.1 hypothetical protein [Silanimonas sp.]
MPREPARRELDAFTRIPLRIGLVLMAMGTITAIGGLVAVTSYDLRMVTWIAGAAMGLVGFFVTGFSLVVRAANRSPREG